MTLHDLLTTRNHTDRFSGRIKQFSDLCDQICVITDQENQLYLENSFIDIQDISSHKVSLLKQFEEQTHDIFSLIKTEAPNDRALQTCLLEKVQDLQGKLKANTGLHMHVMQIMHDRYNGLERDEQWH